MHGAIRYHSSLKQNLVHNDLLSTESRRRFDDHPPNAIMSTQQRHVAVNWAPNHCFSVGVLAMNYGA
jgi:hypothetical protein